MDGLVILINVYLEVFFFRNKLDVNIKYMIKKSFINLIVKVKIC